MTRLANRAVAVPTRQLTEFNRRLPGHLGASFGSSRHLSIEKLDGETVPGARLDYGLVERSTNISALDDRGMEQPVVHLCSNERAQQHLLIGLNFSWLNGRREARYRATQILVFFAWGDKNVGRTAQGNRRQLLRLEWEGVDSEGAFEAKIAAHPHWQTDQWLAGYDLESTQAASRLRRSDTARDFETEMEQEERSPNVRWVRSVHLAAAAHWATNPWTTDEDCSPHARPPKDLQEVENWTVSSVRYISHQLQTALRGAG